VVKVFVGAVRESWKSVEKAGVAPEKRWEINEGEKVGEVVGVATWRGQHLAMGNI